jgi:hypothetical protein
MEYQIQMKHIIIISIIAMTGARAKTRVADGLETLPRPASSPPPNKLQDTAAVRQSFHLKSLGPCGRRVSV